MRPSIVLLLLPVCLLGQIVTSSDQAAPTFRSNITVCLLPRDEGDCRALLPHYYYDRYTQKCEEFLYGGCGGNDNNFETLEDCEKTCWKIKRVPKPCRMEVEPGPCRGYFRRFAYNMFTMKCEKFYFGGCYGNGNNFQDEASCVDKCAPKRNAPSFCYRPKDEGSCSASVSRYYFNIDNKSCEEFQYTGCGGNSNNFVRLEDCNNVCKKGVCGVLPEITEEGKMFLGGQTTLETLTSQVGPTEKPNRFQFLKEVIQLLLDLSSFISSEGCLSSGSVFDTGCA